MNINNNWKERLCREIILKDGDNSDNYEGEYFSVVTKIIGLNIVYEFAGEIDEKRKIKYQKMQKCICDFIKKEEIPITEILKFFKNDLELNLIDTIGFKNLANWPYPHHPGILQDFTAEMDPKDVWTIFLNTDAKRELGYYDFYSFLENFKGKINPKSVDPNEVFKELLKAEACYYIDVWFTSEIFKAFMEFEEFNLKENISLLQERFESDSAYLDTTCEEMLMQIKDEKVQEILREMNILPPKWYLCR